MNPPDAQPSTTEQPLPVERAQRLLVLVSVFVVGACGLMYELIAGAVASYLLGDSVTQYSLVIGVFLAAMGLGSYLTQWVRTNLLSAFLRIQVAVGLIGGYSGLVTFAAFAYLDDITPVVLAITAAVGVLVGMEIPLVIRLLKSEGALRVNLAQVLAVDYVGALAASVAFPFLVLPLLGLTRAAVAFGMLNLAIASLGTAMFWRDLPRRKQLSAGIVAAWIALAAGLLLAGRATTWLEDRLYQDDVILAETTPYQRIVVTRWRDDVRLHLSGHLQFSSADEYRYHEALVLPALAAADPPDGGMRVLVLGGGDGLAVRDILRFADVERIDLVDIDRRVVELFRDNPLLSELNAGSLRDPRVHMHHQDAFVFLRELGDARFDVIVMDLPDPSGVATNKLYTETFFGLALRKLAPRGALVTQASSPFYARQAYWCVVRTIDTANSALTATAAAPVDREILAYHAQVPSFGEWGFVLASPQGPLPERWPDADVKFLTFDVFARSRVFPPDSDRVAVEVNQLDDPVLVRYHNRGWALWNQ